jgi:anti-sigma B factor antagonist
LQNRCGSSNLSGTVTNDLCSVNAGFRRFAGFGPQIQGQPLDIEVRTQAEVKVIKLRGKLVLGGPADKLSATFADLLAAGDSKFILDLQEVPMIDSSGIGLLVRFLTAAKQKGGSIKLLNPAKMVIQTLKLVRILNIFEVYDDLENAIVSYI